MVHKMIMVDIIEYQTMVIKFRCKQSLVHVGLIHICIYLCLVFKKTRFDKHIYLKKPFLKFIHWWLLATAGKEKGH